MRSSPSEFRYRAKSRQDPFPTSRFGPRLAGEGGAIDELSESIESERMNWFRDVDDIVFCICASSSEARDEVLDMSLDHGAVRADMRAGESGANDFATPIAMFSVCASGEDVRGACVCIAGEDVEIAFFEAVVEAIDRVEGFWG